MPFNAQVLKVLIASPGDTGTFRDSIEDALHDWNGAHAEETGVVLLARRWETDSVPLVGGALDGQSVINNQLVDDADIVFGVFHARLGSATPREASGTAEELKRSQAAGKPVHVYFARVPLPHDVDPEQLQLLRRFRDGLSGLYGSFESASELRIQVLKAVAFDIRRLLNSVAQEEGATPATTPETALPGYNALNEARQDLFAQILDGVVEQYPTIKRPKRGSRSWLNFAGGPFGSWSVNTPNNGRLRVEAYLDLGSKKLNKQLFDEFYINREDWESKTGLNLSWERLDDKQASRIAAYSSEVVRFDRPNEREAARRWATHAATVLYRTMDQALRSRAAALRAGEGGEPREGLGRHDRAATAAHGSVITKGPQVLAKAIQDSPAEHRPQLQRLHDWAVQLEADGLAVLYSSHGKGRWVLNPRLPGQERGLVTIWNENGASMSPYRTVLAQEAPKALAALDEHLPGQIKQGNYLKAEYDDTLLGLFRDAYEEAAGSRAAPG